MKKHTALLIGILLTALAIMASGCAYITGDFPDNSSSTSVPDGPRISFDATSASLGDFPADEPMNFKFTFTNTGSAPLEILSATGGVIYGC